MTIKGSTSSSAWTFKLEVQETATSIQNKTSTVRVRAYLGRASSTSYLGGNYNLTVTCGGKKQSSSGTISYPTYINAGEWHLLKTFTFTISNTGNPTVISISSTMSSDDFTPSSAKANGSLTLTKLHDAPNITSCSLIENNTQLTDLNVSNDTIVQYLSNKTATINVTTYDDATITNYSIYHNNVLIGTSTTNNITINFSDVGKLLDSGTGNVGLMIAVTDSLEGYSTKMFDFPVIKYTKPTIEKSSTSIKRKTGGGTVLTDNKAILNFVGTCYKGDDVIGNNNTPEVQYKIWDTTEPSYITLNIQNVGDIIVNDYEISDLLYTNTYDYKIKITDTFTTTESTINLKVDKLSTGISVWTEYKDRVDFKKITIGSKDVIYPIGSTYITESNTDPANILGFGNWELYDKEFEGMYLNNDDGTLFTPNNTNISEHSVALTRNKNTIRIRLNCTLKVDVADTKVILGKLNFGEIGISRITSSFFAMVGGDDEANALFIYNVAYDTGEISIMDVIGKSENKVPSGTNIYLDFTSINHISHILDEACDKFYWRRTI